MERQRKAQVVSIAYDDPQCGWRVRLRVPGLWRTQGCSTVQTEPRLDVRCTRFAGKFLELILFDEPGWRQGEDVTLTFEPEEPTRPQYLLSAGVDRTTADTFSWVMQAWQQARTRSTPIWRMPKLGALSWIAAPPSAPGRSPAG